jgi:chromosome segregation ATPase
VLLVAALGAAGYLYATTRAYSDRLAWTEDQARAIGADLTLTRSELAGARAELDALQAQLTTAQERITALADEKAQIGDDREAQRQLLDYQARVSQAAGTVASALDRCVQGQDQLITYLEDAESYDPAELSRFGTEVETLCQSASDANEALQSELVDR